MIPKSMHLAVLHRLKQQALRDGYGTGLVQAGRTHDNVVVLSADLKESTRCERFAETFPERFIEVGVAEQNMAGIAAGLGISGKIPFLSSYAVFSPGRNWEQLRTTVCYNDANVKIAGHHAGLSTGPDGATHQALEDVALMRALPNMTVIVPCDAEEARKATLAACDVWGPVYLRFARPKTNVLTTDKTPFTPGHAERFFSSRKPQVAVFACGSMVYDALKAAEELERDGVGTTVYNVHTIKPLDTRTLLAAAKQAGAVVTVEEHSVIGGLGGAVAELLAEELPVPLQRVGTQDTFGESGAPDELLKKYGLDAAGIKRAVRSAVRKKQ